MSEEDKVVTTVTLTKWHWILLAALIGVPSGGVSLTNWRQADRVNEAIVSMDKRMIVLEENQKYIGKVQDSLGGTVQALSENQTTLIRVEQTIDEIRRRLDKLEKN